MRRTQRGHSHASVPSRRAQGGPGDVPPAFRPHQYGEVNSVVAKPPQRGAERTREAQSGLQALTVISTPVAELSDGQRVCGAGRDRQARRALPCSGPAGPELSRRRRQAAGRAGVARSCGEAASSTAGARDGWAPTKLAPVSCEPSRVKGSEATGTLDGGAARPSPKPQATAWSSGPRIPRRQKCSTENPAVCSFAAAD